jgi:hypothetical protein
LAETKKAAPKDTETSEGSAAQVEPVPEASVYPRADLIAGASGFDATPEDMAGALHDAGLTEATREQAEAALAAWKTTEV